MPTMNCLWRGRLLSLLAGMMLAGGAAATTHALVERDTGLRQVVLAHSPVRVAPETVRAVIAPYAEAGFARLDLAGLRQSLEALPWVARAQVRRDWPDRLVITLHEHEPMAALAEGRFLMRDGSVAAIEDFAGEGLPRLDVDAAHARKAYRAYRDLETALTGSALQPALLARSARGSWTLVDRDGVAFRLGKGDPAAQVERIRKVVIPALTGRMQRVAYVDLRYGNGFAVGWDETGPESD
ncbi:MAG: cell division protein FtsQ/DivIB [Algiphilus sp.]